MSRENSREKHKIVYILLHIYLDTQVLLARQKGSYECLHSEREREIEGGETTLSTSCQAL